MKSKLVTLLLKDSLTYNSHFRMETLMGYQPEHLMGKSLYDCHHGHDSESLIASFKCCKYFFNNSFVV